jgi:hypothetical protein
MYAKDAAIRAGQSLTVEVSNKPYVDKSIPPQSNDFRWADNATIQVFSPEDDLIVNADMEKIYGRPGWYTYRIQTKETWCKGIYRVVVRVITEFGTPGTSGTSGTGTSGTSGNPDPLSDIKVSYFRLMDLY